MIHVIFNDPFYVGKWRKKDKYHATSRLTIVDQMLCSKSQQHQTEQEVWISMVGETIVGADRWCSSFTPRRSTQFWFQLRIRSSHLSSSEIVYLLDTKNQCWIMYMLCWINIWTRLFITFFINCNPP